MIDAVLTYQKDPSLKTKWSLSQKAGEIPAFRSTIYVSDFSSNVKARRGRRSNIGVSAYHNGRNRPISSIYLSTERPELGYGDLRGTNDLLLFRFTDKQTVLEAILLQDQKGLTDISFDRFLDGQLDEEIEARKSDGKHNNPPLLSLSVSDDVRHRDSEPAHAGR